MNPHLKSYTVKSKKIRNPFRCVLISDLHNKDYGQDNDKVYASIRDLHPDIILCSGDIIIGRGKSPQDAAFSMIRRLPEIAPVYFSNGNHETQLKVFSPDKYSCLTEAFYDAGIHVLNNASEEISLRGNRVRIYGLELGLSKYKKFRVQHISERYLRERIGYIDNTEDFNILIAHNPEFGDFYCRWGADLIVSGHYHGGLIRSPFSGRNMLSPYGFYYPKYGYGQVNWTESGRCIRNTSDRNPAGDNVPPGSCMITSAGLGDHRIPIRIFNPHEIVCIDVKESEWP